MKSNQWASVARPRVPATERRFERHRWPGRLYFKRLVVVEGLTAAGSVDIDLLAAAGATWSDIHYATSKLAPEVARAADVFISAGHGDWYAARYTRFIPMPRSEREMWSCLFKGRPGRVTESTEFDLVRARLHAVHLEDDGLDERYELSWPGKRDAHFAALTPIRGAQFEAMHESAYAPPEKVAS